MNNPFHPVAFRRSIWFEKVAVAVSFPEVALNRIRLVCHVHRNRLIGRWLAQQCPDWLEGRVEFHELGEEWDEERIVKIDSLT